MILNTTVIIIFTKTDIYKVSIKSRGVIILIYF